MLIESSNTYIYLLCVQFYGFTGMALGTVISLPFSGILASVGGWESVFYVQGGLALIWCGLWLLFVYDSPEEHPRIHPEELKLFEMYRGNDRESPETIEAIIMETKLSSEETNTNEVLTSTADSDVKDKKTWSNKRVKRTFDITAIKLHLKFNFNQ